MDYRPLGRTGLRASAIGLGCVTFGREIGAEAAVAILDRAFERGVNLVDTAAAYGDGASEEVLGRWLAASPARRRIIVATKVSGRLTREAIARSAEESLRRLGVERIDLLQAHDWDSAGDLEEILGAFDELVAAGKIGGYGCSNWPAEQVGLALELAGRRGWRRLEAVQPRYSLVDRDLEAALLPLCRRHDLGVISYSPLGAGFLTGKYAPGRAVPAGTRFAIKPGHQRIYFHDRAFEIARRIEEIARREGCTPARLALGWILRRPHLTSVLIGARHTGQVDQAFEALAEPPDPSVLEELDRLSRPDPPGAEAGDAAMTTRAR